MLFVPFRKEVLQYSSLYSPWLYWWCSSPFIPSKMYSCYLHPSETDILGNNPLQKNFYASIDPFRKSHKHPLQKISSMGGGGGGVDIKWNEPHKVHRCNKIKNKRQHKPDVWTFSSKRYSGTLKEAVVSLFVFICMILLFEDVCLFCLFTEIEC